MELLDSYLPVFKLSLNMVNNPDDFADYDESRNTLIKTLVDVFIDVDQCETEKEEKEAAYFAVIAWLDEIILCSGLPWRQQWQGELLQRIYLNTTVAGSLFYDRLQTLDSKYLQARRVFLFCLQNGFHGKYGTVADRSDLLDLIKDLRQKCLPECWMTWPGDAPIVPPITNKQFAMPLHKSLLPVATVCTLLIYGFIYLFLRYYFI